MRKNNIVLVIVGVIILLLFIGLGLMIWLKGFEVGPSFYQFKLTEVLQILTTLIVGFFVTYFLSKRTSNEFRRREIYFQLLERIQKTIEDVYSVGAEYVDNPNSVLERRVLGSLKSVGIVLSTLRSMRAACDFTDLQKSESVIVSRFIKMRAALTESPFGQVGTPYSQSRKNAFQQEYQLLLNEIYKCKIQIFS
jgi:hypothetical protein